MEIGAFVDGFNLYHGLHAMSVRRDLWLDIEGMLNRYVRAGEHLAEIHYFTATVHGIGQPEREAGRVLSIQARDPRRHQMPDTVDCPDGPAVRPAHWK